MTHEMVHPCKVDVSLLVLQITNPQDILRCFAKASIERRNNRFMAKKSVSKIIATFVRQ